MSEERGIHQDIKSTNEFSLTPSSINVNDHDFILITLKD